MATTTRSRSTTRRRRARGRGSSAGLALAAVLVVAIALAVALSGGSATPASSFDLAALDTPVIDGAPLAPGATSGTAPSVRAPALLSEGEQLLPMEGEGTMVVFLAHWCQYCNAEVPVVTQWLQDGGLPMGTEVVTVATAIDPTKPNFPPDTWLRERDWLSPTLVDTDGSIAEAYGVTGFPYWVFVTAEGEVVGASGPMAAEDLTRVAEELRAP